jgi:L-lactate dehydrogenase
MKHTTVAVIGVGAVGSTIAYALLLKNSVSEIILIDVDVKRCSGEVKDLADVLGLSYASKLMQGTYEDAKRADIIIIAAGRPQKPGEPRTGLIDVNKGIMKNIVESLKGLNPKAIVIVVANPLDILTHYAIKHLGLPAGQIFGAGTFLDSQRLKHYLACQTGVAEESIDAWVVGEHGDSQLVAWSLTHIAGAAVERFGITEVMKKEIALAVKNAAYDIIQAKGATFYGIATCVATLCDMIIYNTRQVVSLSWFHPEYGVCMSLPVLLTDHGIARVMPVEFSDEERELLAQSAAAIKRYL